MFRKLKNLSLGGINKELKRIWAGIEGRENVEGSTKEVKVEDVVGIDDLINEKVEAALAKIAGETPEETEEVQDVQDGQGDETKDEIEVPVFDTVEQAKEYALKVGAKHNHNAGIPKITAAIKEKLSEKSA
jgi:hypothetical protein